MTDNFDLNDIIFDIIIHICGIHLLFLAINMPRNSKKSVTASENARSRWGKRDRSDDGIGVQVGRQRPPQTFIGNKMLLEGVTQDLNRLSGRPRSLDFRLCVLQFISYLMVDRRKGISQAVNDASRVYSCSKSTLWMYLSNYRLHGSPLTFDTDSISGRPSMFDSDSREIFLNYVRRCSVGQSGTKSLRVLDFQRFCQSELNITASGSTIRRILNQIGVKYLDSSVPDARASYSKRGHDRNDVVWYRQNIFIPQFLKSFLSKSIDFYVHDETTIHCNMSSLYHWIIVGSGHDKWGDVMQKRSVQKLNKKGASMKVLLSAFMSSSGVLMPRTENSKSLVILKRGGIYG